MASISCPKCQKVFTHPKYQSKAQEHLNQHLARKNACDGSTGPFKFERTKTREKVPNIDSLDLTGLVESLDGNIRFKFVASHIFKFLNDKNAFAVWPNVKIYEVYYMDEGNPVYATPGNFMLDFWNRVMVKQVKPVLEQGWDRYTNYTKWLTGYEGKTLLGLDEYKLHDVAVVNAFLRSEAYTCMKSAITGHLKTVSRAERFQTRVDMGVEVPESRSILYVAPDRCSLKNCMGLAVKHGVCEKHVAIWELTYGVRKSEPPVPPFPKEEGRSPELEPNSLYT
jgi:hypothetical protein